MEKQGQREKPRNSSFLSRALSVCDVPSLLLHNVCHRRPAGGCQYRTETALHTSLTGLEETVMSSSETRGF